MDVANIATVTHVRACDVCTNTDTVISGGDATACVGTDSHVRTTVGAERERLVTDSCVSGARSVAFEGMITERVISAAVYIVLERATAMGVPVAVFSVPVVLSKSAAAPTAVLESALLRASAPPPTPVLKLPVLSKKSER